MNVLGCAAMKVIEAHIISVAEPELPGAATVGGLWTCINSALFKSSTLKIVISGAVAAAAWNVFFLLGAGPRAYPSRMEPESAPGSWSPGAGGVQSSGGSAILNIIINCVLPIF